MRLGMTILGVLLCALPALAITVDGTLDPAYGPRLSCRRSKRNSAMRCRQGNLGGSELDAAYAKVEDGRLFLMFTGNHEPNFNKLDIFIDSVAGGENTLSATPDYDFFDPGGCGGGGCWISTNLNGLTFDAGFEADYHLFSRWGGGPSAYEADFVNRQGGGSASVPGSTGVGSAPAGLVSTGSIPAGNVGPNASGTALSQNLDFAINDNNALGVLGGTAAADPGGGRGRHDRDGILHRSGRHRNPAHGDAILISAMINNGDHNFLSNQILGGLPAPQGNLGGDGGGGFIGDLAGVDFNQFGGDQYFRVIVPEPSSLVLLGLGALALLRRRR